MNPNSSLFAKITSDLGINITKINLPVKTNRNFPDLSLRSTLYGEDAPFTDELPFTYFTAEKHQVLMVSDQFRCHYFFGHDLSSGEVWCVGPFLKETLTNTNIRTIVDSLNILEADIIYLQQYYHSLPAIRDDNLLYAILLAHLQNSYGPDGFEIRNCEIVPKDAAHRQKLRKRGSMEYQRNFREKVYATEKTMRRCISEGNYAGAAAAVRKLEHSGAEARIPNNLQNLKNNLIIFNTICRLAAQDGGASPWEIDQYSRFASMEIANHSTFGELIQLRKEMLKKYCEIVRNGKQSPLSPIIQTAIEYIGASLSDHLTLESAAEALKISPSYLSVRFRKETGNTFSEYVSRQRILYAKQLLKETDMPVIEIACECGIPDNNYFSRLFRRKENMTPVQYRRISRTE